MSTIQHKALTFSVEVERDEGGRTAWEDDGHGPVSDWTTRAKLPGERVLSSDRNNKRYYGFSESVKIALRDGWGVADSANKTKGQIAAEAAEADFQRLRAWCNDEWFYVGVFVTLLDVEGRDTHLQRSLWGIESDEDNYQDTVARELAEEIANEVGDADVVCRKVRAA